MDISFEDKENLSQSANQANSTAGFLWMQSQLSELNLSLPKTMNDNPDKEILKCMEVLLQEVQ